MGEFKKGDFVRVIDNKGAPDDYRVGDVHKVDTVLAGLVYVLGKPGMFAKRFEPWQPRVGERVRTISGGDIEYIGVEGVIEADDGATDRNLRVKLDKPIEKRGDTKIWRSARHLEPIISTATPEQPATLKIEAGKFYKTRDGQKVGPAFISANVATFGSSDNYASAVWSDDGRSSSRYDKLSLKDNDIIAEWIDEPMAKPSNDNARPKFKVGDRVKLARSFFGVAKVVATATVGKRGMSSGFVDIVWDKNSLHQGQMDGGYTPDYFELLPTSPLAPTGTHHRHRRPHRKRPAQAILNAACPYVRSRSPQGGRSPRGKVQRQEVRRVHADHDPRKSRAGL
ncbi:hypothetical protein EN837_08190 [bacterium M00.F.Ca.ET.194.01.1.1]|nr:hypothetical protein EN837_08190 [bacterium M00.F.Ca.ET.194.01.1.1]TGS56241.1 hypothetical protein EN822_08190 [bacterium M00.F.Ca.ET.179.01.1.1]TGV49146.1 hypothetical protein EN811_08190 [bacterium M00.F.Ca.ET.168.01.1.1]